PRGAAAGGRRGRGRGGAPRRAAPAGGRGGPPPGLAETRHASASRAATSSTYAPRALAAGTRRNADHPQAPASTTAVITATVAHSGSHSTTASSTAASTTAVSTRVRSASLTVPSAFRRSRALRRQLAEAPLAAGEEPERFLEIRHGEIRP